MTELLAKLLLLTGEPVTVAILFLVGFWFHDRTTWGIAIMLAGFSMVLNPALKEYFALPRPEGAEGFGFPSGHFQGAMCFYGWLFIRLPQTWAKVLTALLLAGIAFGLVYLGYHYPRDIIGSFVVGCLVIGLASELLDRQPFVDKPYLMGCVLLAIGIFPLAYMLFHSGIQKHSLVGYAAIVAVMLVWWKFFTGNGKLAIKRS